MTRPDIHGGADKRGFDMGLAHFAISIGGKERVNALTERLRKDNYTIFKEPRTTGDGYYESVILDPEGNYVEISA
jgi:lactoylglutathione lyase